jgi:hypothetical protein
MRSPDIAWTKSARGNREAQTWTRSTPPLIGCRFGNFSHQFPHGASARDKARTRMMHAGHQHAAVMIDMANVREVDAQPQTGEGGFVPTRVERRDARTGKATLDFHHQVIVYV